MGYPEFLKKYISYSLPEEQKRVQQTVGQMSNFPKPLSKYLSGEAKLGAVKQQPTMGELGYAEQQEKFTNPYEYEKYIFQKGKMPSLKEALRLLKLKVDYDFKRTQPIGNDSIYRKKGIPVTTAKQSRFEQRLGKVSDIAGIMAMGLTIADTIGLILGYTGLGVTSAKQVKTGLARKWLESKKIARATKTFGENPTKKDLLTKMLQVTNRYKSLIQNATSEMEATTYKQRMAEELAQLKQDYAIAKSLPQTKGLFGNIIKTFAEMNTGKTGVSNTNGIFKLPQTLPDEVAKALHLPTHQIEWKPVTPELAHRVFFDYSREINKAGEPIVQLVNNLQKVGDPETIQSFGQIPFRNFTQLVMAVDPSKMTGAWAKYLKDINAQEVKKNLNEIIQLAKSAKTSVKVNKTVQQPVSRKVSGASPTAEHISDFEQKELTKKGLTGLQPTEGYIYVGIRNPKTLEKIKQSGKLKVDRTSEKMGIFATPYISIANDYAKRTGVILKIPFTEDLKKAVIPDKIDKRLKQVRINKDIDLSNALIKQGDKWEKFKESRLVKTFYHGSSGMNKMPDVIYTTSDPSYAKHYGGKIYEYKIKIDPKKVLHIKYDVDSNFTLDGRKMDFTLLSKEDIDFIKKHGYDFISADKPNKEGFEFIVLKKTLAKKGKQIDSSKIPEYKPELKVKRMKPRPVKTISVEKKTKEPWEMTKEEYINREVPFKANKRPTSWSYIKQKLNEQVNGGVISNRVGEKIGSVILQLEKRWDKTKAIQLYRYWQSSLKKSKVVFRPHEYKIQQALQAGKPVPPEVLKEYPDLEKKLTEKAIQRNVEFVKKSLLNKPKTQPVAQENPFSKLKTYQKVVKNMGYTPEQVMQEFEKSKKTDEDILKARKKLVDFTHQVKLAFSDKEARKFDKFIHEKYLSKLKSGSLLKVLDERVKQKVEEAEYPKDVENKPGYMNTHIVSKLLEGIKTIVNKAHDWTIAYGELRRTNPEAYDKFITAVDKAAGTLKVELIKLQKKLKPFENKVIGEDLTLMATAIEEGKTPEEAFPDNKIAQKLMKILIGENEATEEIKREYHLTGDFRESYMAALDNEIEKLEKSKKADDVAKAQYLQELREQVEKMRYEPRSLLVSKILSSRNSAELVKKIKNLNALQSSYRHRKGVSTLAEWIDKGIVKPEEVNAIALTALNRVETTTKLIWRKMYKDFEKDGLIRKATPELKEMGWVPADKIGIRDRYLNGKLIQPGLARAFAEYINSLKPASVLDRILGIIKVGNFIKPTIIWKYDFIQLLFRGLYSLNPYVDVKTAIQAIKTVISKDEFYQKLVKSGVLAGSGMEPGKRQLDREIEVFAKQYPKEYSKLAKILRKILGRQNIIVDDKSIGRTLLNIATFYTDALSNITWTGDEIFRAFGVLMAEQMGYSEKEAMAIAKCAFGDYNLLSNSYKRAMHKVFFVYAFRFLMPMEMSKTLFTEPTRAILRTIHGEKVPKYEIERILKALLGFFGIVFVVDWYFREKKGMKPLGHHLGKLAWGYGKTVVENGKKKQIVYKTNYILNMFIKYWNRFTTYDPTNPRSPVLQVIGRVLNWEIQPAYRIGIEIAYNRPSFGNRKYVYDPSDPPSKQIGEILLYAFEQSFRVFNVMDDTLSTDDRVQYAKDQQRIINKHFGVLDKIIMNAFGYSYVRSGDTQRYMLKKLDAAYKRRISEIKRDYPNNPEKRKKMIENAKAWAKRSREYIIKHYPKN